MAETKADVLYHIGHNYQLSILYFPVPDSFNFVDFAHARDSERAPSPLAYSQSSRLTGHLLWHITTPTVA